MEQQPTTTSSTPASCTQEHKKIDPLGDSISSIELVRVSGSDIDVANAARVSYGKFVTQLSERDEKLIRFLIKHQHTSPFEHASVTLRFKVPAYTRSQHHRHRTWSYNEISRRYTDFNLEFYEPQWFRTQHKTNRQASNVDELINPLVVYENMSVPASEAVEQHHHVCLKLYQNLLDAGICREQARGVLSQDMYTEYYGTCVLSNLLKFIALRDHDGAQEEIARVARACLEIATDLFPITVNAYREIRGND